MRGVWCAAALGLGLALQGAGGMDALCGGADRVYVGVSAGARVPVFMLDTRVSVAWQTPSTRARDAALRAALLPGNYALGDALRVDEARSLRISARVLTPAAPSRAAVEAALCAASGAVRAHVVAVDTGLGDGGAVQSAVDAVLDAGDLACADLARNLSAGGSWGVPVARAAGAWRVVVSTLRAGACTSRVNLTHAALACSDARTTIPPRIAALGGLTVHAHECSPTADMLANTEPPDTAPAFSFLCNAPRQAPGTFSRAGQHRKSLRCTRACKEPRQAPGTFSRAGQHEKSAVHACALGARSGVTGRFISKVQRAAF